MVRIKKFIYIIYKQLVVFFRISQNIKNIFTTSSSISCVRKLGWSYKKIEIDL